MTRFVFGMGIALVNHWQIVKKNYEPAYGVDNNQSKWGSTDEHTNLKCLSPEQMLYFDSPEVLITIGDPYIVELIKCQLNKYGIAYKVLVEEIDKWCTNEPLPNHLSSLASKRKKIILFNTPEHDNIGDHLISLSEINFLKKHFSDYVIYEVTDIEYLWYHKKIRDCISDDDLILITGGGFLGSLWLYNGEENVRNIIKEYSQNRIIILPQTIFFERNARGKSEFEKTCKIYRSHNDLTLCARECTSRSVFSSIVGETDKVKLLPDIALLYKESLANKDRQAKTALVCLRKDKEKILTEDDYKTVIQKLCAHGWQIGETSMHSGEFSGLSGRKTQVDNKLKEIQETNLVITDTLHCMISAAITGTPCIAFDNISKKVSNVYEWIKDLTYMNLCEDISQFDYLMQSIDLDNCKCRLINMEKYEQELAEIIRGK